MDTSLRVRTRYAFLWIALVPVALAATAVWLSGQFRQEVAWIAHTYDVRTQTRDLVQLVSDAEDATREYLLTGKPQFPQSADANIVQAGLRLEQVRNLTNDNPVQQRNLRTLHPVLQQAFTDMQDAIAISPATRANRLTQIEQQGDRTMTQVRAVARAMMQEEERLLLARTRAETRTSREVEAIFVAAVLVTLGLLFWASRRMRQYAAQRDRAESAIEDTLRQFEALNRDLEAHVEERTAQLRKVNAQLASSNADLERFAFIASHDLQEPLRMVALFSQLLERSCRGIIDDQASTYIGTIIEATDRMRELLRSLLAYAEVGVRPEEATQPVDLNAVLEQVIKNLRTSIDETGAVIDAARLPDLTVNEGHFIQLFQNLVGNAIKYRSDRPPRIRISVEQVDEHLRFAVADNGIGIEPQYHEKIFVAFKRLHGRQIPGTGVGLAICKRALDRYGGHIWVESQAGMGATFFFTVPAALQKESPLQRGVPA